MKWNKESSHLPKTWRQYFVAGTEMTKRHNTTVFSPQNVTWQRPRMHRWSAATGARGKVGGVSCFTLEVLWGAKSCFSNPIPWNQEMKFTGTNAQKKLKLKVFPPFLKKKKNPVKTLGGTTGIHSTGNNNNNKKECVRGKKAEWNESKCAADVWCYLREEYLAPIRREVKRSS